MTRIFIRKGEFGHAHKETPCEDGGRYWGDESTGQGMTRIAGKVPGAGGRAWNSLTASEEINRANTLVLDFQPPELWENTFLLCKPHSVRYFVAATLGNLHRWCKREFLQIGKVLITFRRLIFFLKYSSTAVNFFSKNLCYFNTQC